MMPNEITVLIDSREQLPLLFPSWITLHVDRSLKEYTIEVKTKVVTLEAGDYTLMGFEDVCIIETKRSLRELHNNVCSNDWPRTAKALKRLANACEYPILLWEMTPSELFQATKYVPDPYLVFDRWMQVVARFNLRLMYGSVGRGAGPRRKLGEQMVCLMLAYARLERGIHETTR